jgi:hypothetical protein
MPWWRVVCAGEISSRAAVRGGYNDNRPIRRHEGVFPMLPQESQGFSLEATPPINARSRFAADSSSAAVKELFSSSVPALSAPGKNQPRRLLAGAAPLTDAAVFHHVALRDG